MARDFSRLSTEQRNPRTADLDRLSVPEIVNVVNREDRMVPEAVADQALAIARAVGLIVEGMKRGGRLVFCGAGTSGRLGVLEAAECPPTFGTPPGLVVAIMAGGKGAVFKSVEGAEDRSAEGAREGAKLKLTAKDTLVGIAASGVTPFVHGALEEARKRRAGRVLVTCNREGVEESAADVIISPFVGPEVVAGSTRLKAGTATKLVLNTLTVAAMVKLGKVYENLMVDLQQKSEKLRSRAVRIVQALTWTPEAEAARALKAAGGSAKTAILMLRRSIDRGRAEALLAKSGGMLRAALELQ